MSQFHGQSSQSVVSPIVLIPDLLDCERDHISVKPLAYKALYQNSEVLTYNARCCGMIRIVKASQIKHLDGRGKPDATTQAGRERRELVLGPLRDRRKRTRNRGSQRRTLMRIGKAH